MKKIYIIFGILQPKSPIEWGIHKEGQFVSDFYTRVLEPMNLLNVSQIGTYLNDEEKEIEFFRPSSMFKICNITRGGLKLLLAEKDESVRFRIILNFIQSSVEFASQELGWDPVPFKKAYEKILSLNFENRFIIWKKVFTSRNKVNRVFIELNANPTSTILSFIFFDKNHLEIRKVEAFSFKSIGFLLGNLIHQARWVNNNEFQVSSKDSETHLLISVIDYKPKIFFTPVYKSLELLQNDFKIISSEVSIEETERLLKLNISIIKS